MFASRTTALRDKKSTTPESAVVPRVTRLRATRSNAAAATAAALRERLQRIVSWTLFPATLSAALAAALFVIHRRLALEWITLAIPFAILAWVAIMERAMPYERSWNRSRGDLRADVSSLLIVAGGLESAIGIVYPGIAATAYSHLVASGLERSAFPSHWPLLLQAALLVLLADLGKYWFHRFGHETDLGWRLHSVHHSVKRVYWLNGFRLHPLYHLINFIVAILPWVCLGAQPQAVALYTVILAISAAYQHANIDMRHGVLNYVFNTNELHRWHHSRQLAESNANYGAVILLWDLLFGTYRRPNRGHPVELGMADEATYPMNSYLKQLLVPFRWQRMIGRIARQAPPDGLAS